jgi:hypothetical protein
MFMSDSVMSDEIFILMIKNVSRNSPLSLDEAQILRDFKASISSDEWCCF